MKKRKSPVFFPLPPLLAKSSSNHLFSGCGCYMAEVLVLLSYKLLFFFSCFFFLIFPPSPLQLTPHKTNEEDLKETYYKVSLTCITELFINALHLLHYCVQRNKKGQCACAPRGRKVRN